MRIAGYFDEIPVNLPEVKSDSPIIIRVCPEWEPGKGYLEGGQLYFSKEMAMNCTPGGGGG